MNAHAVCMKMTEYNPKQLIALSGDDGEYSEKVFTDSLKSPRFKIINNSIKPKGGLWTSTYISGRSDWIEWCGWNMEEWIGRDAILVTVSPSARIFTIDNYTDLKYLIHKYGKHKVNNYRGDWGNRGYPNYEMIQQDYDIIHLTLSGLHDTANGFCDSEIYTLMGWDCESSLHLNNVLDDFVHITL